jgi:hypothetical protein
MHLSLAVPAFRYGADSASAARSLIMLAAAPAAAAVGVDAALG